MKFIVYETTNKINGKKYRGAHICADLQTDPYLGSGKLLKLAIAKYGLDAFERRVLTELSSVEEMFKAEAVLVDAEWVANPNTYNLKVGGEGGWDFINRSGARWNEEKRKAHSAEMKKLRATQKWGPKSSPMLGKTFSQTEDAKRKIAENSAMRLPEEELARRLQDAVECKYPQRGSVKILSEKWKVSHTQVRRFLEKFSTVD